MNVIILLDKINTINVFSSSLEKIMNLFFTEPIALKANLKYIPLSLYAKYALQEDRFNKNCTNT